MLARLRDLIWRPRSRPRRRRFRYQPPGRPNDPKVFCIGFHKTGTSTLKDALRILGYRVTGPNVLNDPDIARHAEDKARSLVGLFDAFQDNPWPILYRMLDREFPGSRFILTIRPADQWLASVKDHFSIKATPMREWIYGPGRGSPFGNEAHYLERYERHNREVLAYFKDRPDDFLLLDVTSGDGWEKLCPFLGVPVPDVPFPWRNSKQERDAFLAEHGTPEDLRDARRSLRQKAERELATLAQRTQLSSDSRARGQR
jgi:hypothetical protein